MANTRVSQVSFARGEICPALYLRTDIKHYSIGLKTLKNGFVHQEGCVSNRSGLEYIGTVKDSSKKVRLIPFVFNDEQTYVIEAGEHYFRFIQDGGYIVYPSDYGTSEAQAIQYDDEYLEYSQYSSDIYRFKLKSEDYETGRETFYIYVKNSENIVGSSVYSNSSMSLYWGKIDEFDNVGGTIKISQTTTVYDEAKVQKRGQIVEIETPYLAEDLPKIKKIQSGDIMTLTHVNYPPYDLIRYSHYDWELEKEEFNAAISAPLNVSATFSAATPTSNTRAYTYVVCAVDEKTNTESDCSMEAEVTAHREANWTVGEYITISCDEVLGASEYNFYRSTNGIYGYIGTAKATDDAVTVYDNGKFSAKTKITNPVTGASLASIKLSDGKIIYSTFDIETGSKFYTDTTLKTYFGTCTKYTNTSKTKRITLVKRGAKFTDDNIEPDLSSCAPVRKNPFENNNYPSCSCYFQQRKVFGNSYNDPQTIWASQSATNNNFNISRPLVATDAITLSLDDREVNEIRHLVPMKDLIVFTSNSEYKVNGTDGIFQANPMPAAVIQSCYGASHVEPIVSGDMILFVQASGSAIRDFGYEYLSDGYDGDELSLFASHLFKGKEVIYIAYAKEPYRIVYVIFDDGSMATLTYNKKQELCGWGRQETKGSFESVAVVREGKEDIAYFVIKRTIDNKEVRYIERAATRAVQNAQKGFFVDCGLASEFSTPQNVLSGLEHLKNTDVIVLADGGVIEGLRVSEQGKLELPYKASRVIVGLQWEFEFETLGVESENTHGLRKIINAVSISVLNSREDFFIQGNRGHITQLTRSLDSINDSGYLYSGTLNATPLNTADESATIHIKQKYPLPLTILAVSAIVNFEEISDGNNAQG